MTGDFANSASVWLGKEVDGLKPFLSNMFPRFFGMQIYGRTSRFPRHDCVSLERDERPPINTIIHV